MEVGRLESGFTDVVQSVLHGCNAADASVLAVLAECSLEYGDVETSDLERQRRDSRQRAPWSGGAERTVFRVTKLVGRANDIDQLSGFRLLLALRNRPSHQLDSNRREIGEIQRPARQAGQRPREPVDRIHGTAVAPLTEDLRDLVANPFHVVRQYFCHPEQQFVVGARNRRLACEVVLPLHEIAKHEDVLRDGIFRIELRTSRRGLFGVAELEFVREAVRNLHQCAEPIIELHADVLDRAQVLRSRRRLLLLDDDEHVDPCRNRNDDQQDQHPGSRSS